MGFLDSKLNQSVTWWRVTAGDGYGGDVFQTPVVVKGRWEDRQETYIGVVDRRELISKAVVFVDRDVAVGDYLYNGVSVQSNPSTLTGALKIQRFDKVPDLRSLDAVRRAVL